MEQPVNSVVVGFDFSKQAVSALRNALDIAARNRARVHIVTSLAGHLDTEVEATPGRDMFYAEGLFRDVEAKIDATLENLDVGEVLVTKEVTMAKTMVALFEAADLSRADLIVVGVSGLSAMGEMLVGSTTAKLLRKSRWPVLVAKPGVQWPPKRILCPIDFSSASRRALGWAGEMATMVGAMVAAVHVIPMGHSRLLNTLGVTESFDEAVKETRRREVLDFMHRYMNDVEDLKGVPVEAMVAFGRPDDEIVRLAEAGMVDLLCMGSVGRDGVSGVLVGNTAERVCRRLPCSMLTVKPDDFVLHH